MIVDNEILDFIKIISFSKYALANKLTRTRKKIPSPKKVLLYTSDTLTVYSIFKHS